VTNVRNLTSPFWRSALKDPARRCIVPVTRFCEWTAEPDLATKRKSKVWFGHNEHPVLAIAGIWRPGSYHRWLSDPHESACELAVPYSDERMAIVD
jgi:putative SOS response-associated peptidase YedK